MGCGIDSAMWRTDRVTGLSPSEKLLWAFLLTGPAASRLPGLSLVGYGAMAEAVGVSSRRAKLIIAKMQLLGFLDYNETHRVAHIPGALSNNRPDNSRVLDAWFRAWSDIPNCKQKYDYVQSLRAVVSDGSAIAERWAETFGLVPAFAPSSRQPRPRERRCDPVVPKRALIAVAARDGDRCRYCGAEANSIDYVLPRRQGGGNEPENLVVCCLPCNTRKGNRTPEQAGMALLPIGGV